MSKALIIGPRIFKVQRQTIGYYLDYIWVNGKPLKHADQQKYPVNRVTTFFVDGSCTISYTCKCAETMEMITISQEIALQLIAS